MKLLVTHRAPDIDAITSVWIFKRFDPEHFADAKIEFVDAGGSLSKDRAQSLGFLDEDIVHCDTGHGPYDHHQSDRAMERVCASSLVFDEISKHNKAAANDWALQQIVEFANADDHFEDFFLKDRSSVRHLFNLRWIISGAEKSGLHDDESQIAFGFKMLDSIYASLRERYRADDEMKREGIQFESKWGKGIAVLTANQSVTRFGQLEGNFIVVQKDPKRGGVNIKAAPIPEIDLTPLYEKIKAKDTIGTWYFHGGRHMIINNSSRAQHKPTKLSLQQIIEMIQSL
jgi:hypothetical protein